MLVFSVNYAFFYVCRCRLRSCGESSSEYPIRMPQVAALHKHAAVLLTEHLPRTFDLTLINVGVTNLHPHGVPSGPASLPSLFGRATTPPGAAAGGAQVMEGCGDAAGGAGKRCMPDEEPQQRCVDLREWDSRGPVTRG